MCGYDVYNLGQVSGYGTTAGSEMGGIVGEAGYENWKQEALPPMPVIAPGLFRADQQWCGQKRRHHRLSVSGCYGTVYAISSSSYGPNGGGSHQQTVR